MNKVALIISGVGVHRSLSFILFILFLGGCSSDPTTSELKALISGQNIEEHIKILASDEFMGRRPGTEGEVKTIAYIQDQLRKAGVKPANGDSYLQEFVISEIKPIPPKNMIVKAGKKQKTFEVRADFIAKTNFTDNEILVEDQELVFVGFGIVAPEYNWDDYDGIDVKGKVVVALYSDPGLYDSTLFRGNNSTQYADANYKHNLAKERGAAGFFTIFKDTGPTGMNWPLVQIMATRSTFFLEGKEPATTDLLPFTGMLSIQTARELMQLSGQPDDYISAALSPEFKPAALGVTVSMNLSSQFRKFKTHNVIGVVEGAERPDEFVIYTAHWDHDGIKDVPVNGDSILNGAIDNASGTAMVMETARAFASLDKKPERSVMFFLTSAEEMGLLGAYYYADHPLYPLHKTVCVINADGSHATEPMRVAVNVLKGHTDVDTLVAEAAKDVGRVIVPDDAPQIGAFQRSDHFPLVARGVPAAWVVGGEDPMEGDSAKAVELVRNYGPTKYHQVTDEYYEGFIVDNIKLDATLNFLVGYKAANMNTWPNWKKDSPYRLKRDSLLKIK